MQARGHLARVLAADLVVVRDDDHVATLKNRACDVGNRGPLAGSAGVCRRGVAALRERVRVLLAFDDVDRSLAVVFDELTESVRHAAHTVQAPFPPADAIRLALQEPLAGLSNHLVQERPGLIVVRIRRLNLVADAVVRIVHRPALARPAHPVRVGPAVLLRQTPGNLLREQWTHSPSSLVKPLQRVP